MACVRHRGVSAIMVAALLFTSLGVTAPVAGAATKSSFDPRVDKVVRSLFGGESTVEVRTLGTLPEDADDTIATAQPLVTSATSSLDVDGDRIDVYKITLTAGHRFGLRLTGNKGLNADALLYAPGTTKLVGTPALVGTTGDAFGKSLIWTVAKTGTYYVAVTPVAGLGSYTLTAYSYPWAGGDNDIPGVAIPASGSSDTLNVKTDPDDVFAVSLSGGQRFTVTVSAGAGLDADLYLYDPLTKTILTGVPVDGSAGVGVAGKETFVFDLPGTDAAAKYFLDVRARSGLGSYKLTWTKAALPASAWDDETDAIPLAIGKRSAGLNVLTDVNDLYSIGVATGQRLSLDLTGAVGTDFDVYVYGPGTTRVLDGTPVAWSDDWLSTESLVFDCLATGTYYVEVRTFSGSGAYTLSASLGSTPAFSASKRLQGLDRYATAIKVSADTFAPGSCETVVLATGEDFPDALSASALAGALRSPMLLTRKTMLPAGLLSEIKRIGATKVEIIGGEGVVGPEIVSALTKAGLKVTRTFGKDRYLTSAAVARRVAAVTGARTALTAFLVNGRDFADANAVSPYAYSQAYPVLLTEAKTLPAATKDVAAEIGVTHLVIAGGTAVVSSAVESQMLDLKSVTTAHREGGANRFETAAKVATYAVKMFWGQNMSVGVATGRNFADALGGGAAIGARGGVLLLTEPASLAPATQGYLKSASSDLDEVRIFGGTGAVTDPVKKAIDTAAAGK